MASNRDELARSVVTALVHTGITDATRLANAAFHIHHPDRDLARRIDPVREPALAREWKALAQTVVQPALQPAPQPAGRPATAIGGAKVLVVGDSHTDGPFGVELERLLTAAGANVVRDGRIGWSVGRWLPVIRPLLRQHAPAVVIVALGANMRHGYPEGPGRTNQVKQLLAIVRAERPAARVIWIGPPRERADTLASLEKFNDLVRAGLDARTQFVDSGPLTPVFRGDAKGIHYAAEPARTWARGAYAQIAGSS